MSCCGRTCAGSNFRQYCRCRYIGRYSSGNAHTDLSPNIFNVGSTHNSSANHYRVFDISFNLFNVIVIVDHNSPGRTYNDEHLITHNINIDNDNVVVIFNDNVVVIVNDNRSCSYQQFRVRNQPHGRCRHNSCNTNTYQWLYGSRNSHYNLDRHIDPNSHCGYGSGRGFYHWKRLVGYWDFKEYQQR
ncbi:hypothetical protein BO82DRAFT_400580 [Aspergillus uvarum CBS 121591]|uniref:Uncharacterized protein n=1 Tax=Aspergillus uvarum CBS 121591 TaxID=1448315 RepID=A0A319CCY7_9EURO|nr:hypothetical protein BO82DRAFT_400580 [Aspergillus uvarum CBS 121591]PYH83515.1 hypothetical protein BO82DRAFT_400580 [Aspergillus uvarum CBS 121591]